MKDLARNLKKYFSIFIQMQKIGIMNRMAYRVNFFIMAGTVGLQMFFGIFFINIIYGFFDNLAGWGYYEALLILGAYMLIEGVMWTFFGQLQGMVNHIKKGTLDGVLLKPIDPQFLVSIWRGDPEDIARIMSGIAVIGFAFKNLSFSSAGELILNAILYTSLLVSAIIIAYSINFMVKLIAFWVIEGHSLSHLADSILRMSQYPVDVFYHKAIRMFFTVGIPLAFIATVPAKIAVSNKNLYLICGSFLIATILLIVSRKFWLFALRRYKSASS